MDDSLKSTPLKLRMMAGAVVVASSAVVPVPVGGTSSECIDTP
ncbi:MAG: hypothetical protein ACI90V_008505 [Bacillariaceae sp.]|jgi:hypothetical protein